jgi:hypothetical protein
MSEEILIALGAVVLGVTRAVQFDYQLLIVDWLGLSRLGVFYRGTAWSVMRRPWIQLEF